MQQVYRRRRLVALALVVAVLAATWWVASTALGLVRQLPVEIKGLRDGRIGVAAAAAPEIRAPGGTKSLQVDGVDLLGSAERRDGRVLVRPAPLAEGKHTVSVSVGRFLRPARSRSVSFTVDAVPPEVSAEPLTAIERASSVVVKGTVEKGATVRVGATEVKVKDGRYELEVPAPVPVSYTHLTLPTKRIV